ncbi:hypothetical protein FN846DRAFT_771494 [Sphaerosporella brunnea]|uniref:Protein kinase domain-containing protein n=1 Tax=Sphaerosporella brunnea TaxID=1250544 RepID=A0A5J5F9F0_9PEZI|nr:hypothetical protein FN846DRAFT_771494 [Sphaerosporella brunnea]
MPNFTCTFVREIQTTSAAAVLLVALPDSTRRVLKLFPPPRPSCPRDPFLRESTAYASLQQHSVANVPRCHGTIEITALRRQLRGSAAWHSAFKQHQRLRGLLLDFIPDATTLMAAPERLLQRPALVDAVVAGLERIHQAGVLHQDTLPRNIMVDAHDRVWWIDFGCALSTAAGRIDPREFEAELEAMRDLLREDVVPAAREGRTPEWWIIGA